MATVFVGSIPYDTKEEEIKAILETAGPVVSFRIVTDKETGKPKGYGFCEYKDEETALSARRNLQGYEFKGRQLRIDSADKDKKPAADPVEPVAIHVAKLPKHHLIQVISDLKAVALQNKEQARQLLQSSPSLPRAILQALVILGQAPPQQSLTINNDERPSKQVRLNEGTPSVDIASLPQDVLDHLLQQVLRLRPEQLTCLPVHQQQLVIELQHKHGQTS